MALVDSRICAQEVIISAAVAKELIGLVEAFGCEVVYQAACGPHLFPSVSHMKQRSPFVKTHGNGE